MGRSGIRQSLIISIRHGDNTRSRLSPRCGDFSTSDARFDNPIGSMGLVSLPTFNYIYI